ncbi:MAG: hypothetical protein AB8H79_00495 [Myxococcota bacterium]
MKTIQILVLSMAISACGAAPDADGIARSGVELTSFSEEAFLASGQGSWESIAPGVYEQTSDSGETSIVAFGAEGLAWEREHVRNEEHAAWLDEAEAVLANATDERMYSTDPLAKTDMGTCGGDTFRARADATLDLVTARVTASAHRDLNFGPAVRASYRATSDIWFTNDSTNDGDSDRDTIVNGCCGISTSAAHSNVPPVPQSNQKCRMAGYAGIVIPLCSGLYVSAQDGGSCDGIGFPSSTR